MYSAALPPDADDAAFRKVARQALSNELRPQDIAFVPGDTPSLFENLPEEQPGFRLNVPRSYVELLQDAICHRAEDRFALLYDVLWRMTHGEPALLSRASDPSIARLSLYAKAIRRDIHKMHAFLRFHRKQQEDGEFYLAWFEPEHFILRSATPFFVERFAHMRWVIATPIGTAVWDMNELVFAPAQPRPEKLEDDILDGAWRTYYRTIFNPARLNTAMMKKEMPRKYWHNMPEASLISDLVADASERVAVMDRPPDEPPRYAERIAARERPYDRPDQGTMAALKLEAARCTACPLHQHATQTVFGEGPADARLVFVGEQPGDSEDIAGKPFIGPAGQVFDRALQDAGIDRRTVYVTNAVKHFKFEPRGKRRIHSRPNTAEVQVCRRWLSRELDLIEPRLVVALGATAAQALFGKALPVTKMRGQPLSWADGRQGLITVHPSFLLRLPDEAAKAAEFEKFVADLKVAALISRETRTELGHGESNAA